MNNEKAIRVLEEFKVIDDWTIVHLPEMEDAVDVAIEALKVHDICAEMLESAQLVSIDGDTISRQAALDSIGHDPDDTYDRIKSLPSAEPKTGEWVYDPNGMDWNIPAWRCSECGFRANYIGVEANGFGKNPMNWAGSKFCPECGCKIVGADMRGEEE